MLSIVSIGEKVKTLNEDDMTKHKHEFQQKLTANTTPASETAGVRRHMLQQHKQGVW
jgi:hypothetical protein